MKKIIIFFLLFIIFSNSFTSEEYFYFFIRNSNKLEMEIKLVYKLNQKNVYENIIPKNRTVKIENLEKGDYILYYKTKGSKEWRVMNILINSSDKTYVLF